MQAGRCRLALRLEAWPSNGCCHTVCGKTGPAAMLRDASSAGNGRLTTLLSMRSETIRRKLSVPLVAAVAFALLHLALRLLAAVRRERAADLVLRFGELSLLAADVTFVAGMGLDQLPCHLCSPEG